MSKLLYIDSDEEIISVIGRLRSVSESEIFLAAPKRALFLQSLINLRLLAREAKKVGKILTLVSQDKTVQSIAKKAGINVVNAYENEIPEGEILEDSRDSSLSPPRQHSLPPTLARSEKLPDANTLGSSEFFLAPDKESTSARGRSLFGRKTRDSLTRSLETPSAASISRRIPVRDRTPRHLTALNSSGENELKGTITTSFSDQSSSQIFHSSAPQDSFSEFHAKDTSHTEKDNRPESKYRFVPSSASPLSTTRPGVASSVKFFHREGTSTVSSESLVSERNTALLSSKKRSSLSWKGKAGIFLLGGIFLGGIFFAVIRLLPHVEITAYLFPQENSASLDIVARTDTSLADDAARIIPARFIEKEIEVSRVFSATGTSSIADRRSRGLITISNTLEVDQPLVATTRFETPEGKIFRLVKGLVVPAGGKIDAEVIADQSGGEFDISPTTFTVPGLSGSAKFVAITALSSKAFSGGSGNASEVASVSADDVVNARSEFEKSLDEEIRKKISEELTEGEILVTGAVTSQTLSSGAFPGAGAVAPNFEYRFRVALRAIVFSGEDIDRIAKNALGENISPEDISFVYGDSRPDFVGGTIALPVTVTLEKDPTIDTEAFTKRILGKNQAEIKEILSEYPEIKRVEISFRPEFLSGRVPSRVSQVSVRTEVATEESSEKTD